MCGIVGYIGKKQAKNILLEGLKKLEYRGYDSAGIAVIDKNTIVAVKKTGKVEELEKSIKKDVLGNVGIAHTRWATHGKPTVANAHPQCSCDRKIYLVHNGIIENYQELKERLKKLGHKFVSDTDTEVVAHLIEENYKIQKKNNFQEALIKTLQQIKGAYGLAIITTHEPEKLYVARCGSPLLIGVGKDGYIVASDASAIIEHTKKVVYLDDGELSVISPSGFKVFDINKHLIAKNIATINWDQEKISKDGFDHFMQKEIHEIDQVILNSTRGRIQPESGTVKLGGLESVKKRLAKIDRIIIVGCGTARFAGLVGEYMIEEYAGVPVEVEYASEFRYRKPIISKNTVVLAISQSGETADTLAAIREAKAQGALTLGIVNVVGSTIARDTDAGVYNHIGPETAVASTKALVSQIVILIMFTIFLGQTRNMNKNVAKELLREIKNLSKKTKEIFKNEDKVKKIAQKYKKYDNFLFLGRKNNYPIAEEGALKLKEVSYVHAEGYPTGEMKHGPIAMINENFPTICICPKDTMYKKNISGIEEIKARNGKVVGIGTKKDKNLQKICDDVLEMPESSEAINPILAVVLLQMLAYYMGVVKGYNVDRPRNLAKSVTVE